MRRQRSFVFRTWGGKRRGSGRKRSTQRARVPHGTRPALDGRTPVHVTLRLELGGLRSRDAHRAIRQSLARTCTRDTFRICQYSIQSNHVHLLVEPADKDALTSGMISFKTSCAKRLNAVVRRSGRVFADRYHARPVTSPSQARRAFAYVLSNWRRHRERGPWRTDPFSSADAFDGWMPGDHGWRRPDGPAPVAASQFWLLTRGWRRHGMIDPFQIPGPHPSGR